MNTLQNIQKLLGVVPDGVWGPKSQIALNTQIGLTIGANRTIESIQALLGVAADGKWGNESQSALARVQDLHSFTMVASSFADPADLRAFERCKAQGKTDLVCFKVGDNGIGQFGKITAQTLVPMVAVHKDRMVERWGSVQGAAHRPVEIILNGAIIQATVEDRISAPGRIDCNPAVARLAGINPPFTKTCTWKWL